jgi:hypothetical protein
MDKTKVSIGPTTVGGTTISLAAFAVAIVAFAQGARDEETFSALGVGALALLTTLGGRYGQAIAQALSYGTGLGPARKAEPETVDYGGGFTQTVAPPKARRKPKGT